MKKRILCIFMALVMIVALMPERAWAGGPSIPYIDWDDEKKELVNKTCTGAELSSENTQPVNMEVKVDANGVTYKQIHSVVKLAGDTTGNSSKFFIVKEDLTLQERMYIEGDVTLILCDGATLNVPGISVPKESTLRICGQADGTGKLISTAKGGSSDDPGTGSGIGGFNTSHNMLPFPSCGTIIINGGIVEAYASTSGAGIGSTTDAVGENSYCGDITINGGSVYAKGYVGTPGIGCGDNNKTGSLTINGGTVVAEAGTGCDAGINGFDKINIAPELQIKAGPNSGAAEFVNRNAYITDSAGRYVRIGIVPHEHNDISFKAWPETGILPSAAGNYYLTEDVTLSATWTVPKGTEASPAVTNLCLNGHVIKVSEESVADSRCGLNVIKVPEYAELNIYDNEDKSEHYFNVGTDGLWTLTAEKTDTTKTVAGGIITGGSYNEQYGYDRGGGIYVNGGTLNLYGGSIVGNASVSQSIEYGGGGVYLNGGNFNMYDGSVEGNKVASWGGGVFMKSGYFCMSGGRIANNNAIGASGGGVRVYGGTFEMKDGEISDNSATSMSLGNGSGVSVKSDGNGKFIMTGGTITGNVSDSKCNAVELNDNVFIGGTAKIIDNVDIDGNPANVTLNGSTRFNIGTGTGEGKNGVAVPEEGMCIHLGLNKNVYALPVAITTNGTADDAKYFVPDNASGHEVVFKIDHLELGKKDTPVDIPTANTGLVYDGFVKTGVYGGLGYYLTYESAIDAGTYTAVATLANGYIWSDGTKDAKQIEWSVAKAMVIAPTIAGKMYTGTTLVADVNPDDKYEVTKNEGGIEVGSYDVVITLKDSVNYKWLDSAEAARTLKFEITAKPEYSVTGYSDEFGNGVTANVQTAPSEEKVALTVTPADEYLFKSLNVTTVSGERVEVASDNTFTMPAEAVVVNAVFEKEIKKYTVSFSMNGQGAQVDSQIVIKGQTATRPATPAAVDYTFNGWFADDSLTTAFDFATPITADTTVYAKWAKNQAPAPTPDPDPTPGPTPAPTPDVPAVTDTYSVPVKGENTVKVEAKLRDGNADVKEITLKDIDKIFSEASEEEGKPVTVDLSGAKQEINSVTLTKKSFENIAGAVADESNPADSLEVKFTDADMILDSRAVEAVNEQAKGDKISLIVEEGKDIELNRAQQKAIENENVVTVVDVRILSNGKEIHDFNGGIIKIEINFDSKKMSDLKHFFAKYVAENGKTEDVETTNDGRYIIFKTGHLSDYVIVYDESRENGTGAEAAKAVKAPYIKLSKTIGLGNTFSMAVTNVADDANVKYSSSDRSVATVDGNGVITAVGIGRCTVKGVIKQHGTTYKFAVAVTVKDTGKGNRSIKADECLTPNSLTPLFNVYKAVNTARPFKLNIKRLAEDAVVTFTSEDETVAEVSKDGVITGLKKGYTGISVYVKQNGQTLQYRVFVRVSDK